MKRFHIWMLILTTLKSASIFSFNFGWRTTIKTREKLRMDIIITSSASHTNSYWTACMRCHGEGRLRQRPSRKARMKQKRIRLNDTNAGEEQQQQQQQQQQQTPILYKICDPCKGSGIILNNHTTSSLHNNPNSTPRPDMPNVVIIGGGIGGLALAIGCLHRSIPFTVYERDPTFLHRKQGYGLTLQQASKSLKAFGVSSLGSDGITSTKHVVHDPSGTVIGEWGLRKWGRNGKTSNPRRQNVHIARQALRKKLLDAIHGKVQWGSKLVKLKEGKDNVQLTFQAEKDGRPTQFTTTADLVVGADGIRSTVRQFLIGEQTTPLRYLGCIVILGICQLKDISIESPLLDGETVFQTADGNVRIYSMPFSTTQYMWQLSYPLDEHTAKETSQQGPAALKAASLEKCGSWHSPVPELLRATPQNLVSGYPVYDRTLLNESMLTSDRITLLGDAAHPMSPFKGQGANQAMLDGLSLARAIFSGVDNPFQKFESEMLERSSKKVQASADAAKFLHSDVAIQKGDVTRGQAAKDQASGVKNMTRAQE